MFIGVLRNTCTSHLATSVSVPLCCPALKEFAECEATVFPRFHPAIYSYISKRHILCSAVPKALERGDYVYRQGKMMKLEAIKTILKSFYKNKRNF